MVAALAIGRGDGQCANAASSNKNLVLIQGTKADNFYVTMGCGAKYEAKKLGYNITVEGPASFSAPQQIPIVQRGHGHQAGRGDDRPDRRARPDRADAGR